MKVVDARGKACPQPVLLTKKEADAGENNIIVIVDNDTSKLNVIKFGNKFGFNHIEEKKEDGIYITLVKNNSEILIEENHENNNSSDKKVYVFGSNKLGKGSDELGKILMKGFIYAIAETKPYPSYMIFFNYGVKLTTEGSDSIDDLKRLEDAGVKIVSCGTCLDFFEIKGKLLVGNISNMYDIVETITNSDSTIMI